MHSVLAQQSYFRQYLINIYLMYANNCIYSFIRHFDPN